ncbi:MAG: sulfite exporter TauE/SafE family protein [Candidatus Pelagibacter sp.]
MVPTAAIAGFFAGLFGIGGGLITVPFLFFIFETLNFDKAYLMHLSVGTSFAIIIPTSIVSVLTHKKHKSVDIRVIKNYGIFVISGVLLGTILAANLKTDSLLLFFTIVVYFLGAYLLNINERTNRLKPNFSLAPKIILGFISGFISAPMGIGGAVMNVPILRYFGYPINKAIGSASAIGFIIAFFGGLGFFLTGTYLNANLPLSIGFINIPAFLIFIPITMFMASIGANTSNKMNKSKLQRFFGIFLYVIGTLFLYRYLSI